MKHLKLLAPLAAVACAALLQAQNPISQPVFGVTGEKQFGTHYYRLYTGLTDLEGARKIATRDGGYLVEINSAEENQFLNSWFEAYVGKFLIGATRNDKGQWLGSDGKVLAFVNWADPETVAITPKTAAAAVIEFGETGGKWDAVQSSSRVSGFILEFNTKPKPLPRSTETYGFDEQPELVDEDPETIEKNEPTLSDLPASGLSANLFFSKYVYAGGIFRDRYAGKEISIAGFTRVADIREITEDDRVWSKYKGKFFMRLLGDNIICFLNSMPLIEGNSARIMVKVEGKITKGPQFQQIILDDARFMNYRRLQSQRRLPTGKDIEELTQVTGALTKFDRLLDNGTFELQVNQEGATVTCTLGTDPDGYGMELYWLKNTASAGNLVVNVVGAKSIPDDPESPLINCFLGGWADPAAAAKQRPKKEERKKEENGK